MLNPKTIRSSLRPGIRSGLRGGMGTFSPLTLSPILWLDPYDKSTLFQDAAGTTPVTADGDPVGRISDTSGSGNHATQSTTASKPEYDEPTNSVTPDGVDDWMGISSNPLDRESFTFVLAIENGASIGRVFDSRGAGSVGGKAGWQSRFPASLGFLVDDGNGNAIDWTITTPDGQVNIVVGRYESGKASARVNGLDQGAPNETGGGLAAMGSILSGEDSVLFTNSNGKSDQFFDGEFHQGGFFDRYLSDEDVEKIEAYVAEKVGVTL